MLCILINVKHVSVNTNGIFVQIRLISFHCSIYCNQHTAISCLHIYFNFANNAANTSITIVSNSVSIGFSLKDIFSAFADQFCFTCPVLRAKHSQKLEQKAKKIKLKSKYRIRFYENQILSLRLCSKSRIMANHPDY